MDRGKASLTPENEIKDLTGSSFPSYKHNSLLDPVEVSSSSSSSSSDDENDLSNDGVSNQLVLYDPLANANNTIELVPDPLQCEPLLLPRSRLASSSPRVLPSVGAFTVQCASCFKWRLIPTKEKYEEIREHILEQPFVCQKALEWRPDVSCDDPEDISQDDSKIWAIDKPSIAQPPAGWQRLLRIRGEGSTKFADIYYVAPSGKVLRSMVEIQKFLMDHPEYMTDEVTLSRFSFQIPKPLQKNYVRKRPARLTTSYEGSGPVEFEQVSPLAWAGPEDCANSQGRPELPAPYMGSHVFDPINHPAKKQATQSSFQKDDQ
ncbi:methyl-CpG-binding domain-containing protein 2 [Gastrolobium bilobum]|uniref:methyl-CpG-binding domain-containing protein 2 n=1 Tax=Gastrolobium bilobum TaxID=150636 RepID=UPI002AB2E35E|nr:methyl-CpG-binding domain-containing protein 2 [Gastrolobium bilobum]XP_061362070.1 methyl-CpG-binding domain-containing protein 2 [Gastrolobium bilobum]